MANRKSSKSFFAADGYALTMDFWFDFIFDKMDARGNTNLLLAYQRC